MSSCARVVTWKRSACGDVAGAALSASGTPAEDDDGVERQCCSTWSTATRPLVLALASTALACAAAAAAMRVMRELRSPCLALALSSTQMSATSPLPSCT